MLDSLRFSFVRSVDVLLTEIMPFRGSLRLSALVAHAVAPPPQNRLYRITTRHGFVMEVAPFADRGVDRSVYYQGTQEIGTIRVLQELLQPGDWFIDVGANIGVLSLVGAQAVGSQGSVWAFEPNPASFAFLKTNIELNNATQVRLFPIAVGAGLGSARIRYASFYKAGATLKPGTSPEEGIEVPVDSLDSLVGRECTQRYPKVIKVDVEGWEYEVVRGQARC